MEKDKEKQLNDEKLEEVNGGADSETDEMMEGPLKVYHTIQDIIQTMKDTFGNQQGNSTMKEGIGRQLNYEELSLVNGGENVEIVSGTKDLSSGSTQNILSYTEPDPVMTIMPFVENSAPTIQKYIEPVTQEDDDVETSAGVFKDLTDYQKRPGGY